MKAFEIALGIVSGLLLATASLADPIPDLCQSLLPCGISLVGTHNGVADPIGVFTVTLRDFSNNPVPNARIAVSFVRCCGDIRLTDPQPVVIGPFAGQVVESSTNAAGLATFIITGAALGGAITPGGGCAEVFADGVLLTDGTCHPRYLQVAVYDLNGASMGGAGVGAADLGIWLNDFFAAANPDRSDYDFSVLCVKGVGPADLGRWLSLFFASGSVDNGPAFTGCP